MTPHATTFRDNSAGGSLRTKRELEVLLQQRLRYIGLIGVISVSGLGAVTLAMAGWQAVATPRALFVEAPLLGWIFLTVLGDAFVAHQTSPSHAPSLDRLRAMEWGLLIPGSVWLIGIFHQILLASIPRFSGGGLTESTVAMAGAAPWVVWMFVYAVLVPNSWRRCATMLGLFAACAIVPEMVVLFNAAIPFRSLVYVISLKVIILGGTAAAATYGAHRIDTLASEVHDARKLGQYVLGERLGAGGMGEVYRAEHRFLRRPCAVKLIRPEMGGDPELLARFEREVQATAALTHPNTVQVFDYGRGDDGTFFYVMEYLPGHSLEQLVERDGPMTPGRAVHLLAQVCGALHEAHEAGLIHRDIKPSNVIVCERGGIREFAKVLDFGLVAPIVSSDSETRMTQVGMTLGTPAFMSPEQAAGGTELGVASDIYSLGALAYFLLSGRVVFSGRTPVQMLAAHIYEPPPRLDLSSGSMPAALEAVVMRCLAKAPEDRFSTALELQRALQAIS